MLSAIVGAAQVINNVAGQFGGGNTDPDLASKIWKDIKSTDILTLTTLNVDARPDGWYDASRGTKLTQEDAYFRSNTLMASLIGAKVPSPRSAWIDASGRPLTNAQAWAAWASRYGTSRIEDVLRAAKPVTTLASSAPAGPGPSAPSMFPALPTAPAGPAATATAMGNPSWSPTIAAAAPSGVSVPMAARVPQVDYMAAPKPWYMTPVGMVAIGVGVLVLARVLLKSGRV